MSKKFLEQFFLFQEMNEKELEEIKKIVTKKVYKKNEIIFLEGDLGDSIYLVLDGLIKVFRTGSTGREKTLSLLGRGDFFGEMALLDNNFRSASVQAIKSSQVYIIDKVKFYKLLSDFPQIPLKIIVKLSQRLRKANNQIKNLTFKSVRDRLEVVLLELANRYGERRDEGLLISKKITHQELGNLVGTTRESITKLINEMVEEKKLLVKNRYLILLDFDK
ncbi:Crp/Fnr family transcriptional regulator [Orenia marismortui]|uniref:Crp/Fnr family transcriptional regulator n=1 Tax=Orenia marismortui TaxID=46469 RepID=UPI000369FF36|nr:Crp/Fnr family transcriptional regulator [Orenia marismortui]